MHAIWEFFQQQLNNNQLFGGGLLLMIGGGLVAVFRSLPYKIWRWCRARVVMQIDIMDRDPAFDWINQWLADHNYSKNYARCLTVSTAEISSIDRQKNPDMDCRPKILFAPAPGRHILFYRGRLMLLDRNRPQPKESGQEGNVSIRETFTIEVFGRDRSIVKQLLEDARDVALPKGDDRLSIYRPQTGYYGASWVDRMKRLPRPSESVVLRQGLMESLIEDVKFFIQKRDWYVKRGIPYRYGCLLYGPPGTGKSSTILAIASALKMDLAILSLTNTNIDDDNICMLLSEFPANAIILIEDIDCVFNERKGTDDKANKLTFSGLLNAIDGVAAGEGRILFATTNHIDKLDPALIRHGRIDRKEYVGNACHQQLEEIFIRFYGQEFISDSKIFAQSIPTDKLPMSSIQSFLIKYSTDPNSAIENIQDLMPKSDKHLI